MESLRMNERQQSHIDYFLERLEYWNERKRDPTTARMLAARDAHYPYPLRSEEEGWGFFDHFSGLKQERHR